MFTNKRYVNNDLARSHVGTAMSAGTWRGEKSVLSVVSFPNFHYNDTTELLQTR